MNDRNGHPGTDPAAPPQRAERKSIPSVLSDGPLPAASQEAAAIEVDARIVAEGLGIAPEDVEPGRQAGTITTLCERGIGEDAGLIRATFYFGQRRLRLVVDSQGRVLQQEPGPAQPNR